MGRKLFTRSLLRKRKQTIFEEKDAPELGGKFSFIIDSSCGIRGLRVRKKGSFLSCRQRNIFSRMDLSKMSMKLLTLACLIYTANTSAIKVPNHHEGSLPQSSSRSFGVKTVTRQSTHSNDGVVTRVFKQTRVQTGSGDSFQGSPQPGSENQEQSSGFQTTHTGAQDQSFQQSFDKAPVDHSSGHDDVTFGLLPADNAQPTRFGTRLGGNSKTPECGIKGGCSSTTGDLVLNSFDNSNTETNQGQSVQATGSQGAGRTVHSNGDQEDVGKTQQQGSFSNQGQQQESFSNQGQQQESFSNQGQQQESFSNQGQQQESFSNQGQQQESFSNQGQQQESFSNQGQQQESFSDQGQQETDIYSNDFDSQYENTLRNLADEIIDTAQIPIGEPGFNEQGNSQTEFGVGNVVPFLDESDIVQQQQDLQQQRNSQFFGYRDQQSQSDSQDRSDQFVPDAVDQQNVPLEVVAEVVEDQNGNFEVGQGSFQQQDARAVEEQNEFAFDQGTNFPQQFVPQSQVSNENSYNYQDQGQDFFLADRDPIEALRYNVPGSPGEDYPIFYKVPDTSFQCDQQQFPAGIYGDMDAQCQVFHFCTESGGQDSFLCPNGTVFNQQYFVCDWWYNYNCSDTPSFYNLNAQLYWDFDSFEPTQILTGTGIGSSVEDQFDNSGEFHSQVAADGYSGSIPEQVQFQTRVTQSDNRQVHTTSSHQQVSDIGSSVQQHSSNSFVENRQDGNSVQRTFTSSFAEHGNSGPITDFDQQAIDDATSQNFNTHRGQQATDSQFINNPTSTVTETDTNAGVYTQAHIDTSDFQRVHQVGGFDETNFGQSQSAHSDGGASLGDFSVTDRNSHQDSSVPSTSSDTRRGWKPDDNSGTQFPDQNGFVQEHLEDHNLFLSNRGVQKESVSSVVPQQIVSSDLSSHGGSDVNQVTQTGFTPSVVTDDFLEQNRNLPDPEIHQQAVEFPVQERSAEDGDIGTVVDGHSVTLSNEGFSTHSSQDVDQQQSNFDSQQQNVFFKRQPVLPSSIQDSLEEIKREQVGGSQSGVNQPNTFDVSSVPDTFQEVDSDSQSARDNDDGFVSQEKQYQVPVKDIFDGQKMIDVSDVIQDAINYGEVLDGFNNRNVAFMDARTTPQSFDKNQVIAENRPTEEDGTSVQKQTNQNINGQAQALRPNLQQENIEVHDIFSMMRGSPNNFQQENGQQRLSFRPYGQNTAPRLNNNLQGQQQSQAPNTAVQNEGGHQSFNTGKREEVIFPVEKQQEKGQTQWWRNSQNSEVTSQQGGNFVGQPQNNRNQNVNIPVSQSHLTDPSKINLDVPTNFQQVQANNDADINEPQSGRHRQDGITNPNKESFQQNVEQQQAFQGLKIVQDRNLRNDQFRFQPIKGRVQLQNVNNQPSSQNINNQPRFQNANNQQPFNDEDNQPQFHNVNNQQQFHNTNNQQQFNDDNNQQQFHNTNNQQQFNDDNNQQQFHNTNNQQQFNDDNNQQHFNNENNQPQFHNINNQRQFNNDEKQQQFNNNNIQQQFIKDNNQQQFQNVNNQPLFENARNQQQFQNVNNQPQFQSVNNQPQFQNVNNQPQFLNLNDQQQFRSIKTPQRDFNNQPQFRNVNNQQQFNNENSHPQLQIENNQVQFPDSQRAAIVNFGQNTGTIGTLNQHQSQGHVSPEIDSRSATSGNFQQNFGVKTSHSQQNFREARSSLNFPRPNPQTINADDIVVYSQNDPRAAAESAVSYNGWKPIVRS